MQTLPQEVIEAEMDEALRAGKGERTAQPARMRWASISSRAADSGDIERERIGGSVASGVYLASAERRRGALARGGIPRMEVGNLRPEFRTW